MGIVQKQTLKGTIYSYLGVILGGINVALLFPIIFSEEQIGLINILITVSAVSAQFASLGSVGIINYFFPVFRNKENAHNSFFSFITLYASIGFILFTIVFIFWGDFFLTTRDTDTSLQSQYYHLIYPLTFFTIAFLITDIFSSSTFNSSIGNLYKDVIVRILILILTVLYFYKLISFKLFMLLYILNMAIPVIALLIYMFNRRDINFKLPRLSLYLSHFKKILSVGIYFVLSGLSEILATYIDKYMISYYLGLRETGIYSITNYFGTLTSIPRTSMGKIGTPVIAKLMHERDYDNVKVLLKKSSISQVLLGFFIFINIWVNIDLILGILKPSYLEGKWVVLYISLSHIFFCFMGLGGVMLKNSKYYRASTFFTIVLGVSVIIFNLLFIPIWGITGAALSTALSKLLHIVLILVFVYVKMNVLILYFDSFKIALSGFVALVLTQYIPLLETGFNEIFNSGINIVVKSTVVSILFIVMLVLTRFIKNIHQIKTMI